MFSDILNRVVVFKQQSNSDGIFWNPEVDIPETINHSYLFPFDLKILQDVMKTDLVTPHLDLSDKCVLLKTVRAHVSIRLGPLSDLIVRNTHEINNSNINVLNRDDTINEFKWVITSDFSRDNFIDFILDSNMNIVFDNSREDLGDIYDTSKKEAIGRRLCDVILILNSNHQNQTYIPKIIIHAMMNVFHRWSVHNSLQMNEFIDEFIGNTNTKLTSGQIQKLKERLGFYFKKRDRHNENADSFWTNKTSQNILVVSLVIIAILMILLVSVLSRIKDKKQE